MTVVRLGKVEYPIFLLRFNKHDQQGFFESSNLFERGTVRVIEDNGRILQVEINDIEFRDNGRYRYRFVRPPKEDHPVPIVVVILEDETTDTILMGKRKDDRENGLYGLPGGKQHRGETFKAAMVRELEEETGLLIEETQLTFARLIDEIFPDGKHFLAIMLKARIMLNGFFNKEPDKCEGWELISRSQIHFIPKTLLVQLCLERGLFDAAWRRG